MVEIYTKDYCPYCKSAKELLDTLKVEYKEYDITSTPEKMEELSKKSGMMTVPQIFVGDKCLGGFSDIDALHKEGKLEDMLKGE